MRMVEWNRAHIPRLSELAAPILELTGNGPFRWSTACQRAFEEIKSRMRKAIALTAINPNTLAPAPTCWSRRLGATGKGSRIGLGGVWIGADS
jgi:hypothetical protein